MQSPWAYGTTAGQEAAQSEAAEVVYSTRREQDCRVNEAIVADGASLLCLPAYSPDFNPIEQFLAKLKALLRKAAARTKEALWQTAGQLLELVPSAECRNYLANAGYEPA